VTYRLLSYNIKKGGAGREREIAQVIAAAGPDLVVLQEARRPEIVEAIAAAAGLPYWGARRRESLGFLSARPLAHAEWHHPRLSRHAFLELAPEGVPLRVFGVHLSAVHAAWTERRRTFELRALLASVARHQEGVHVLTGDFNTLAPGELLDIRKLPHRLKALVWLSGGRIRWRTIQIVLDAGYTDGYRQQHPDGRGHTFPTWDPHVRLDYLFLPATEVARLRDCRVVRDAPAADASDHFPLLAELDV
jgi:endonuclease/exonuclease/phosphatase family metal-dependent hydrolase